MDKRKALVVDDEFNQRRLLKEILSLKDYVVITASSPREALSYDIANIDLITVDYQMDDMNGLELISIIKSRQKDKYVPIMLITGTYDAAKEEIDYHWGYEIAYVLAVDLHTPLPDALNMNDIDAVKIIKIHNKKIKEMQNVRK